VNGQQSGIPATGTVTYTLFHTNCSGSTISAQTVNLDSSGGVPDSGSSAHLGAGSYAFRAAYSGDGNYSSSTSACETLSVVAAAATVSTVVIDNLTGMAWTNLEVAGSSAHDTASIGGQQGTIKATGMVTYDFFHNGTCTGSPSTS